MNVEQRQFGFTDQDLKTSLHDEIVLWLKQNSREVSNKILDWRESWDAKCIESTRSEIAAVVETRKENLRKEIAKLTDPLRNPLRLRRWDDPDKDRLQCAVASLESWTGLGDPPLAQLEVISELEVPITRERFRAMDIVGYADIVFSILVPSLSIPGQFEKPTLEMDQTSGLRWSGRAWTERKVAFDAKTTIPYLGQLIRKLNRYRAYCAWPFYVVSPEARFAQEIADEGFGFIEYPKGVFLRPRKDFGVH
jgi:hypothetical protein